MSLKDLDVILKQQPPFAQKSTAPKTLSDAIVGYSSLVTQKGVLEPMFGSKAEDIVAKVIYITQELHNAEQQFLSGNLTQCYQTVSKILFEVLGSYNISHTVEQGKVFYRMRASDTGRLFSKEEMFHIPFELRRLVGNQRFSISGHPSLYLGSSIYVCWEELNRPNFDSANIVALRTKRELNLLDLRMPKEIGAEADLYRIPLIVAASVRAKESTSPFKPEYIISQAILHSVLNQNKTDGAENQYDGIIYYSTRIGDSQKLFDNVELFENIVIPTSNRPVDADQHIGSEGFCPVLCKHFGISETISSSIVDIVKSHNYFNPFEEKVWWDNSYSCTTMGSLEQRLSSMSIWEDIDPPKFFRMDREAFEKC